VSHLGKHISALVDGELTGAELDRANAHLAACERCRAEAADLRELKRHLRGLGAVAGSGGGNVEALTHELDETLARGLDESGLDGTLTQRLLAMAGPGGPVPSRRPGRGTAPPRAAFRTYPHRPRRPGGPERPGGPDRPGRPRRPRRPRGASRLPAAGDGLIRSRRRGWYLLWSALSLAVVGIGAAAFSMGGAAASPGPRITPQVEMFSVQHAITSGDVPIPDPAQAPTAQTTP
jgi:hypothetical protein